MTRYELPSNITSTLDYFVWADKTVNGLASKFFLFFVWMVCFTWLLINGRETEAVVGASLVTFVIAWLFQLLGLITTPVLILILIIFLISAAFTFVVGR